MKGYNIRFKYKWLSDVTFSLFLHINIFQQRQCGNGSRSIFAVSFEWSQKCDLTRTQAG